MRVVRHAIIAALALLAGTPATAPAAGLAPIIQPRYAAIVMDASSREVALCANAADEIRHPPPSPRS